MNYQKLPIKSFSIVKTANGTAEYDYKDKHGIFCFTLEENNINSLVDRLPGMEKQPDGSITINGKKVKKILVNGEEEWPKDK